MTKKVLAVALAALALAACGESPTEVTSETGPDLSAGSPGRPVAAGRFIVTLQDRTDPAGVAREHGVQPDYVYTRALNGFAGAISDAARQGLMRDSRVARIEPDGIATVVTTQSSATWGLDRVDQRNRPLSTTYSYTSTGTGVNAYIIDTGIRFAHLEFGGRATSGYDAIDGGAADDCNGHGTHVAGTVGGTRYGVAKKAHLVGVRVLDCSGSGLWSGVIAGIDWVAVNHVKPAVANLSLGGGTSASVDDAVRRLIGSGVATVVAAGNSNSDACRSSPARVTEALTIGATNKTDYRPSWSNYGACLDWFAPGVNITSAWYTGNSAAYTISGTSMASPHTAGVAALYLQINPGASPGTVRTALFNNTTKRIVKGSNTANNHLLFSSY
jgi:subtilisin family serine protease